MNNVHMIGARRKAGRRRERQPPDAPLATVLTLAARRGDPSETAEEKIARFNKAIGEASYHLAQVIQALERAP